MPISLRLLQYATVGHGLSEESVFDRIIFKATFVYSNEVLKGDRVNRGYATV